MSSDIKKERPAMITKQVVKAKKFTIGAHNELDVKPAGAPHKETFCAIVVGSGQDQLLFHHPIGVTRLSDDDWVCTTCAEYQQLLARQDHPDATRIEQERAKIRESLALKCTAGLTAVNGALYYQSGSHEPILRSAAIKVARAAFEAAKAGHGPNRAITSFIDFLAPEEAKSIERAFQVALRSEGTVRAAEQTAPLPPYETRSGPLADRSQIPLPYLKGKSPEAARQAVLYRLASPASLMP